MRKNKDKNEDLIWNIICEHGTNIERWEFVEIDNGDSPQAINFSGYWFSYPDYKKYNIRKNKVLMLIEVKGYDDYFSGIENGLGIKAKQFKSYSKIQFEEHAQIRICFVIWKDNKKYFFWETLNNMKKMEKIELKNYQYNPIIPPQDYYVFDCREFRTDIENLPKFSWDE